MLIIDGLHLEALVVSSAPAKYTRRVQLTVYTWQCVNKDNRFYTADVTAPLRV